MHVSLKSDNGSGSSISLLLDLLLSFPCYYVFSYVFSYHFFATTSFPVISLLPKHVDPYFLRCTGRIAELGCVVGGGGGHRDEIGHSRSRLMDWEEKEAEVWLPFPIISLC